MQASFIFAIRCAGISCSQPDKPLQDTVILFLPFHIFQANGFETGKIAVVNQSGDFDLYSNPAADTRSM